MNTVSLLAALAIAYTCAASPIAIRAPIVITNAGDYVLAKDLVITNSDTFIAIDIRASNVVVNLNGHTIRYAGPSEPDVMRNGIQAPFNSIIRNGRISGWNNIGLLMAGYDGNAPLSGSGRIEHVSVERCGTGIGAAGAVVSHCLAADCRRDGVLVFASTVESCVSKGNYHGFRGMTKEEFNPNDAGAADDATNRFGKCAAIANNIGFDLGSGDEADRCKASRNSTQGVSFRPGAGAVLRNSIITGNHEVAVLTSEHTASALIIDNRISRNGAAESEFPGTIVVQGDSIRVENNLLNHNQPNTIYDTGSGTIQLNNRFVPIVK